MIVLRIYFRNLLGTQNIGSGLSLWTVTTDEFFSSLYLPEFSKKYVILINQEKYNLLISYIQYSPSIRRAEILNSPSSSPFTSFQSPSPINLVS